MSNHRDTSKQLRDSLIFSGEDQFMRDGHQIVNKNLAYSRYRRTPAEWAKDDRAIKVLLLRVFPKLETDEKQRQRAGRWMRVIHLHHRFGHSYGAVAAEMGLRVTAVKSMIQHIRRAVNGFPCNRSSKRSKRATFGTPLGDQ